MSTHRQGSGHMNAAVLYGAENLKIETVDIPKIGDDEVLVRVLVEPEVEHLNDVRMHEPGRRQRLAPEARYERRVVGEVLGEQLDRHVALEALVERQLHGGHAADAEAAFHPVPPDDH